MEWLICFLIVSAVWLGLNVLKELCGRAVRKIVMKREKTADGENREFPLLDK